MITKQDFNAVAAEMAALWDGCKTIMEADILYSVCCRLAWVFKASNPRFDIGRFLLACDAISEEERRNGDYNL